jgi:hypothetical protein
MTSTDSHLITALASATTDGLIVRGPAASNAALIELIRRGATASQSDWSADGRRQVAMVTLNAAGQAAAALARELAER